MAVFDERLRVGNVSSNCGQGREDIKLSYQIGNATVDEPEYKVRSIKSG